MRAFSILSAAAIMAAVSFPAFAQDSMIEKGETLIIMSNGQMATMESMDDDMMESMMKNAQAMDGDCMMMMMGEDGKMYMVEDMEMANGKMACSSMMKQ